MAKKATDQMDDNEILQLFQKAKARGFRCESDAEQKPNVWGAYDPQGNVLGWFRVLIRAMEACVKADIASMAKAAKGQGAAADLGRVAAPQVDTLVAEPQGVLGDAAKLREIRRGARALKDLIRESFPNSRKRSLALTKLEECVLWTVACTAEDDD